MRSLRTMILKKGWQQMAAWAALAVWAALLAGYFFATQPWAGLYVDNQHTYFVQGLLLSGRHPYLQTDWFAQTVPLHIAFTYLVALLERCGILSSGVFTLDVLFRLVFLGSLWLAVNAFWPFAAPDLADRPLRRQALSLSVLTFYLLSLWPVFQMAGFFDHFGLYWLAKAWEKFGFYYSFGGFAAFRYYTEPAAFSVLIFTALALLPYRRWRLAAVLLGVAGLFHASFLMHTGLIAGFLAVYLYFQGEKRTAWQVAMIYAGLALPLALYIATQLTDVHTAAANQILVFERVPHNALPQRWWNLTYVLHSIVVAIGVGVLVWRGRGVLRWLVLFISGTIAAGIGLVYLTQNPNLAIMMPWRASGTVYAFAQLALLAAGVFGIVKVLERISRRAAPFLLIVPLALLAWGIGLNGLLVPQADLRSDITSDPAYPFMLLIREETAPDALLITPLREEGYRLGVQRPLYVDWKSNPYRGADVLEWWQRVEFGRAFYAMKGAERQQACQQVHADYYVLEAATRSDSEPVFLSWGDWVLVPCP